MTDPTSIDTASNDTASTDTASTDTASNAAAPDVAPSDAEAGATAPSMFSTGQWRGKYSYLFLGLTVLVLDQWSKWMVESHLAELESRLVIPGFFNLTHVRNTGVAFGLFPSHGDATGTLVLLLLGLGALAFVGVYFWLVPLWDRLLLISLGLVMGGAVGNLLDRFVQGGVTDFLDFYYGTYHWHTFNVADSAISVGIALMLISAFRQPPAADPEVISSTEAVSSTAKDSPISISQQSPIDSPVQPSSGFGKAEPLASHP